MRTGKSECECGHRFQTSDCRKTIRLGRETWRDVQREEPFGVVEWGRIFPHPSYAKKKKAAYFMRKSRAFKTVPRHGGRTTMTDSIAQRRLVIICNFNRRETRCLPESTRRKVIDILMGFKKFDRLMAACQSRE